MFVDASALTAILADEPDAAELLARMERYKRRITSPLSVWESVAALARIRGGPIEQSETIVTQFLELASIEMRPVPIEAAHVALAAYARYGKGRHPAALNFGDCFAYACARVMAVPLLYKGDDFPLTDIAPA